MKQHKIMPGDETTGDSHEDAEKNLFRELRLHLTSNNSVKNTIITAGYSRVSDCRLTNFFCGLLTSRKHNIYVPDAFVKATFLYK